jgi:hypothetical protein
MTARIPRWVRGSVLAVALDLLSPVCGAGTLHEFQPQAILDSSPAREEGATRRLVTSTRWGAPAVRWETSAQRDELRLSGDLAWKDATHLVLDVFYDSDHCGMLQLRFHARGESEPRLTASLSLFPRLPTRLSFPWDHLDAQRVFLPRTPGRLKGVIAGRRIRPDEIEQVVVRLEPAGDRQALELGNVALVIGEPDHPRAEVRIVDELGQWTARNWPGKTPDADVLTAALRREHSTRKGQALTPDWSRFGGWGEKQFRSTGFFRTERDGSRWWLVDPDGFAFFSLGLDCVRSGEACAVLPGTEPLFAWLPVTEPDFAPGMVRRVGDMLADFPRLNLIRAFGEDWQDSWRELTLGRLKAWRFNTVGNWSELGVLRPLDLPYVLQLSGFPSTRIALFRDFPDVYSAEYRGAAQRFARGLEPVRDDPYLIGYFLRNEPLWGFGRNNLAAEMLEANPGTTTRRALADWLRARYRDDVAAWSQAWGREFQSFEVLVTGTHHRLAEHSKKAAEDLWEFSREMVRTCVRIPCEEVRKVDPNHLNLGMRYAWISSELLYDAGEMFDVFSINCYQMEPCLDSVEAILERTGKPVMIGEFHFGALDRGLPATGLRGVASQAQRGTAYRRYVERAAAHRAILGVHYFTLNDQPLLGRFDGENYQIGFVDVCHTPYAELVDAAVATHSRIYPVHAGTLPPFDQPAQERPRIK